MVLEGMKKQQLQKRTRAPKRGPGFVELEKILRKEENADITTSSSSTTTTNPSASLKSHHHQTSKPSSHGAASSNFPSHHAPPSGSGSGIDHRSQSNSGNQKRKNRYHPPPPPPPLPPLMQMNHFGGSSKVSSGSLSNGLHTGQEPPSIQSSSYQEHKMVGMKRVHTSSLDDYLIPPPNFQGVPSFSHYIMPHQLSTNDNHVVGTYNSPNEGYSMEVSSKRFNSDIVGAAHANFQPFSTPQLTPPPMHLFQGDLSKGNVILSQVTEMVGMKRVHSSRRFNSDIVGAGHANYQVTKDKMEDSHQRSESSVPDNKPFYNFLEVKDQKELTNATFGSNQEGREPERCGIDLSLKL